MNTHYRLKNKKRFMAFVMAMLLLVWGMLFVVNALAVEETPSSSFEVEVRPGDTLWSIASRYCDGQDIRIYIQTMKTLNHLVDSQIHAGQLLQLP